MKISILNFDLSNNSLGRAYILAKMLSKNYEVEILGPKFGKNIWLPLLNDKSIPFIVLSSSLKDWKANLNRIDGDIIYAVKPYGTSYGYAILKKIYNRKPVVLDEDDWDFGFLLDNKFKDILHIILNSNLLNWNNVIYTYILGKLAFLADDVTVSSTFLQKKFGGTIIPHARNKELFHINNSEVTELQKKYNPENKKIIMFYGSIRKHKGVDLIVEALDLLSRKDILLFLVGVDKETVSLIPHRNYIKTFPPQSFDNISKLLSLAYLVILPQKKSHSALGQVPAKLFDAMALGKPIVASNISDIPLILEGCGVIFKTDDAKDLSFKVQNLLVNPIKAKAIGIKAKEKFIKEYAFEPVQKKLFPIFEKLKNKYEL